MAWRRTAQNANVAERRAPHPLNYRGGAVCPLEAGVLWWLHTGSRLCGARATTLSPAPTKVERAAHTGIRLARKPLLETLFIEAEA